MPAFSLQRFVVATTALTAALAIPGVEAGCRSGSGCVFRHNPRYDSYWPRRCTGGVLHHHRRGNSNILENLLSDIFPNAYYAVGGNTNSLMRQSQKQQQQQNQQQEQEEARRQELASPRFNVEETEDAYELVLEVPGVSVKDLVVELEDDSILRIQASRSRGFGLGGERMALEQSFTLQDVDTERIAVSLSDGILRITAPKREHKVVRLNVAVQQPPTTRTFQAEERSGKAILERMLRNTEEGEPRPEKETKSEIIDVVESSIQ